jgi:SAM-dependent methyltransferase
MSSPYGSDFYQAIGEGSRRSAAVVVPLIIDLVGPIDSVVDIGCGTGDWLAEFAEQGVTDFLGLDGPHVDGSWLVIPADRFRSVDLSQPPTLGRQFDVVLCLEVAEHLPALSADGLVGFLTQLSDVVVFSAAIPFQGGSDHVNEQWPEYWREKFSVHGYVGLDPFRSRIWNDERVEPWFAQNLLMFVRAKRVATDERLAEQSRNGDGQLLPLVHPRTYLPKAQVAKRTADLYDRRVVQMTSSALRRFRLLRPR